MTEEKWKSATGHAISSRETDQLTKQPENVTCGEVSNEDVLPLFGYEICGKDFFAGTMKNNGGKVDDIWWMEDITDYSEDALQIRIKRVEFINRAMNERALTVKQSPVNAGLLEALKGIVFQDSNISEDEKLKRYVFAREAIDRSEHQQPDAELLSVLKEVLYYDDKHDALPTHIEFKILKSALSIRMWDGQERQ